MTGASSPPGETTTIDHATAGTPRPKGFPLRSLAVTGWNLFDADVTYPLAVIRASALDHNGATMRAFCERNGVSIAPHGKTTMSPALFRRQMRDGAWAITAATVWQAQAMRAAGVPRVLIANEVVVSGEIEWLSRAIDDGFEVSCYVDSAEAVSIMDQTLVRVGATCRVPVYVELGVLHGRTGARSVGAALDVARAAAATANLQVVGVAGFEGVIVATAERCAEDLVDELLDRMVETAERMDATGLFEPDREVILTAGGSAYFDLVVERLRRFQREGPVRIVIRSGCYLTHDDGALHSASPMGEVPRTGHHEQLRAAIEVWGAVLSRPEPTRAVLGLGKRDVSTDGLLPVVKRLRRRGSAVVEEVAANRVVQVNDQHAYLDLLPTDSLQVGDLVGVGISHPCTTFDKWRSIPIVDDDHNVIEIAETWF
jgi:D-serine dehydratase